MLGRASAVDPLAPMVTTELATEMVAFVGELKVIEKLRAGAAPERVIIGTEIFWAVSPGANVSVPLSLA